MINWNGLNRKINYFYTFNGEKLRKTVEDNGTITKVDYCGPFVYETTSGIRSLKYIATPFGRAVKNGSAWVYEYNLTDHLGNVRVVIKKGANSLAEIVQQKGYYSFGMEISQFSAGTGTSKNWYNGKEIQDDFGLYWYDYGARFYDPALGRWSVIDNKAEKYYGTSPYTYALNNPILFLDPDGNDVKISTTTNRETGRKNVTFTVIMSVRNSSRVSDEVVNERALGVASQIEKSFSGFNSKTNTTYRTVVELDKNETNFVLDFVNDVEGRSSIFTTGKVDEIGNTTKNRMQVEIEPSVKSEPNQTKSETSKTGAHEYGHTLGLLHGGEKGSVLKSSTEPNLMNQNQNSTNINNTQLQKAQTTVLKNQQVEIDETNDYK